MLRDGSAKLEVGLVDRHSAVEGVVGVADLVKGRAANLDVVEGGGHSSTEASQSGSGEEVGEGSHLFY